MDSRHGRLTAVFQGNHHFVLLRVLRAGSKLRDIGAGDKRIAFAVNHNGAGSFVIQGFFNALQ